jgi:hypothetical protein
VTTTEITKAINRAVLRVYDQDKELINDAVHEQTIVARIMHYLQLYMPDWKVDVEFNRQGKNRDPKRDSIGKIRKPDIVIHRRGPNGPNLAVILVKCEWNTQSREDDRQDAENIRKQHSYQAAYVLEISADKHHLSKI